MIEYVTGNLFESGCEALVNTVNCVGAMGAGIALEFKNRFPRVFVQYQYACNKGLIQPGTVYPVKVASGLEEDMTVWVVNFATKDHWKNPSKMEWIEQGLGDLRRFLCSVKPASIAIPPLGCGLGGLNWTAVRPLIEQRLGGLEVKIIVYAPHERR